MSPIALHTPMFLQPALGDAAIDYTGQEFRQYVRAQLTIASGVGGEQGVTSASSLAVTQRGAGANLSVDVASGLAYVVGDDITNQGTYECWNDATVNVTGFTVPGSGTFHHRLVLQVQDKLSNGVWTGYVANLVPVLDTGSGLPAEPASAVSLATVNIPSGSASITNSMITDYRPRVGQIAAFRTSDDSGASNDTSPNDDPVLQLNNLAASAQYEIFGNIVYAGGSGGSEGDIQWTFRTSGSSGGQYNAWHYSLSLANVGAFTANWTDSLTGATQGTGTNMGITIAGLYTTGASPPAFLVFQYAQNSSVSTATKTKSGSFLRARRVG